MNAESASGAPQLYGVGDLVTANKVPHEYVTRLLNRGVFRHTHQWGQCRLFTRERLEEIVLEYWTFIHAVSCLPLSHQYTTTQGNNDSNLPSAPESTSNGA